MTKQTAPRKQAVEAFLTSNMASIKVAIETKNYEALATAGAELGLWYLEGQERRKEPGFMPEVHIFKDGTTTMVGKFADGFTFTSYNFTDGVLKEEYIVSDGSEDNSFMSDLFTRKAADVVMAIGSAWSKGPDVKTKAQFDASSRHTHVVAFANVYLGDAKNLVASKALLFPARAQQAA